MESSSEGSNQEGLGSMEVDVSAFILIPFSTIFIAQLAPLSLLSPYASLVEGHDEGEEQSVLMGSNTTIY